MSSGVLVFDDLGREGLTCLRPFGLRLVEVEPSDPIPGSYWGEPEAGLIGDRIYVRSDTPVHSVLHEAGHYICMTERRRAGLDRDAGSGDLEEAAVCYFQILLADQIPGCGRARLLRDMDLWDYSFRRGSTRAWFEGDAEDARAWLEHHGLVDEHGGILWKLRFEE